MFRSEYAYRSFVTQQRNKRRRGRDGTDTADDTVSSTTGIGHSIEHSITHSIEHTIDTGGDAAASTMAPELPRASSSCPSTSGQDRSAPAQGRTAAVVVEAVSDGQRAVAFARQAFARQLGSKKQAIRAFKDRRVGPINIL